MHGARCVEGVDGPQEEFEEDEPRNTVRSRPQPAPPGRGRALLRWAVADGRREPRLWGAAVRNRRRTTTAAPSRRSRSTSVRAALPRPSPTRRVTSVSCTEGPTFAPSFACSERVSAGAAARSRPHLALACMADDRLVIAVGLLLPRALFGQLPTAISGQAHPVSDYAQQGPEPRKPARAAPHSRRTGACRPRRCGRCASASTVSRSRSSRSRHVGLGRHRRRSTGVAKSSCTRWQKPPPSSWPIITSRPAHRCTNKWSPGTPRSVVMPMGRVGATAP